MAKKKTTVLAEDIKAFLDSRPAEAWSGMSIGPEGDLQTILAFDPTTMFEEGRKGIYILPVVREYNIGSSQGRGRVVTLNSNPTIVVCIYYPFSDSELDEKNLDVAKWDAVKRIINLREEMEELILKHQWDLTLTEAEAEAAENIPLSKRAFFSPTVLTFEDHC